jgi:hypothetical protein
MRPPLVQVSWYGVARVKRRTARMPLTAAGVAGAATWVERAFDWHTPRTGRPRRKAKRTTAGIFMRLPLQYGHTTFDGTVGSIPVLSVVINLECEPREPDVLLEKARKIATQHRGRIFDSADPAGEKQTEHAQDDNTVQALYELYRSRKEKVLRSWSEVRRILEKEVPVTAVYDRYPLRQGEARGAREVGRSADRHS